MLFPSKDRVKSYSVTSPYIPYTSETGYFSDAGWFGNGYQQYNPNYFVGGADPIKRLQQGRYDNQGIIKRLWNTTGKTVLNTGLNIASGYASITAAPINATLQLAEYLTGKDLVRDRFGISNLLNSPVNDFIDNLQEDYVNRLFAVYSSPDYKDKNFFGRIGEFTSFLGNEVSDMAAFAASTYFGGAGVMKATRAAVTSDLAESLSKFISKFSNSGKLTRVSNMVANSGLTASQNAAIYGSTWAYNVLSESAAEARGVKKDLMQQYQNKEWCVDCSAEEANKKSDIAANEALLWNLPITGLGNIFETGLIMRGFAQQKADLLDILKTKGKNVSAWNTIMKAKDEAIQEFSQFGVEKYYTEHNNDTFLKDAFGVLKRSLIGVAADTDSQIAGFLGGIMGAGMSRLEGNNASDEYKKMIAASNRISTATYGDFLAPTTFRDKDGVLTPEGKIAIANKVNATIMDDSNMKSMFESILTGDEDLYEETRKLALASTLFNLSKHTDYGSIAPDLLKAQMEADPKLSTEIDNLFLKLKNANSIYKNSKLPVDATSDDAAIKNAFNETLLRAIYFNSIKSDLKGHSRDTIKALGDEALTSIENLSDIEKNKALYEEFKKVHIKGDKNSVFNRLFRFSRFTNDFDKPDKRIFDEEDSVASRLNSALIDSINNNTTNEKVDVIMDEPTIEDKLSNLLNITHHTEKSVQAIKDLIDKLPNYSNLEEYLSNLNNLDGLEGLLKMNPNDEFALEEYDSIKKANDDFMNNNFNDFFIDGDVNDTMDNKNKRLMETYPLHSSFKDNASRIKLAESRQTSIDDVYEDVFVKFVENVLDNFRNTYETVDTALTNGEIDADGLDKLQNIVNRLKELKKNMEDKDIHASSIFNNVDKKIEILDNTLNKLDGQLAIISKKFNNTVAERTDTAYIVNNVEKLIAKYTADKSNLQSRREVLLNAIISFKGNYSNEDPFYWAEGKNIISGYRLFRNIINSRFLTSLSKAFLVSNFLGGLNTDSKELKELYEQFVELAAIEMYIYRSDESVYNKDLQQTLLSANKTKALSPEQIFITEQLANFMINDKDHHTAIVTGSAGTGKTFTITQFLQFANLDKFKNIVIIGPKHKEMAGVVHGSKNILSYSSIDEVPDNITIDDTLFVIDEIFNIDSWESKRDLLTSLFLSKTHLKKTKIIGMGDPYQIASGWMSHYEMPFSYFTLPLTVGIRSNVFDIANVASAFYGEKNPEVSISGIVNYNDTYGVRYSSDLAEVNNFTGVVITDNVSVAKSNFLKASNIIHVKEAHGLEYDNILVALFNQKPIDAVSLRRYWAIVYTMISRAIKKVTIFDPRQNINFIAEQIENPDLAENETIRNKFLDNNIKYYKAYLGMQPVITQVDIEEDEEVEQDDLIIDELQSIKPAIVKSKVSSIAPSIDITHPTNKKIINFLNNVWDGKTDINAIFIETGNPKSMWVAIGTDAKYYIVGQHAAADGFIPTKVNTKVDDNTIFVESYDAVNTYSVNFLSRLHQNYDRSNSYKATTDGIERLVKDAGYELNISANNDIRFITVTSKNEEEISAHGFEAFRGHVYVKVPVKKGNSSMNIYLKAEHGVYTENDFKEILDLYNVVKSKPDVLDELLNTGATQDKDAVKLLTLLSVNKTVYYESSVDDEVILNYLNSLGITSQNIQIRLTDNGSKKYVEIDDEIYKEPNFMDSEVMRLLRGFIAAYNTPSQGNVSKENIRAIGRKEGNRIFVYPLVPVFSHKRVDTLIMSLKNAGLLDKNKYYQDARDAFKYLKENHPNKINSNESAKELEYFATFKGLDNLQYISKLMIGRRRQVWAGQSLSEAEINVTELVPPTVKILLNPPTTQPVMRIVETPTFETAPTEELLAILYSKNIGHYKNTITNPTLRFSDLDAAKILAETELKKRTNELNIIVNPHRDNLSDVTNNYDKSTSKVTRLVHNAARFLSIQEPSNTANKSELEAFINRLNEKRADRKVTYEYVFKFLDGIKLSDANRKKLDEIRADVNLEDKIIAEDAKIIKNILCDV